MKPLVAKLTANLWITTVWLACSFAVVPDSLLGQSEQLQDKFENSIKSIETARREPDPMQRERVLRDAIRDVQRLVEQHPNHDLANAAQLQLGNANVELAREHVKRANLTESTDVKKDSRFKARILLSDAMRSFEVVEKEIRAELERIDSVDLADRMTLNKLRGDYLRAKLLIAASTEELAEAHDPSEEKRDQLLAAAAGQYNVLYKSYRTRLAGLYARLYEGRCLQKRQEFDKALAIYDELLDQPAGIAAIDTLRKKASDLAASCRQERDSTKD